MEYVWWRGVTRSLQTYRMMTLTVARRAVQNILNRGYSFEMYAEGIILRLLAFGSADAYSTKGTLT